MIPIKLIEAVQRRAVLRRLMQDARTLYGPIDSSTPKELIECGEIVPVNHNVVPVNIVHEVVKLLGDLVKLHEEEIEGFSVTERPTVKPKATFKEGEDNAARESGDTSEGTQGRKKPLRR